MFYMCTSEYITTYVKLLQKRHVPQSEFFQLVRSSKHVMLIYINLISNIHLVFCRKNI